jgi:hypothetical protein
VVEPSLVANADDGRGAAFLFIMNGFVQCVVLCVCACFE